MSHSKSFCGLVFGEIIFRSDATLSTKSLSLLRPSLVTFSSFSVLSGISIPFYDSFREMVTSSLGFLCFGLSSNLPSYSLAELILGRIVISCGLGMFCAT